MFSFASAELKRDYFHLIPVQTWERGVHFCLGAQQIPLAASMAAFPPGEEQQYFLPWAFSTFCPALDWGHGWTPWQHRCISDVQEALLAGQSILLTGMLQTATA